MVKFFQFSIFSLSFLLLFLSAIAQPPTQMRRGTVWQYPARFLAYRAVAQAKDKSNLKANWRWKISLWKNEDHEVFAQDMTLLYPPIKK